MDVGIYVIQGMCYTTGMEPVAVTAQEGKENRFWTIQRCGAVINLANGISNGLVAEGQTSYQDGMELPAGWSWERCFELTAAFNYTGQRGATPAGPMSFHWLTSRQHS